MVVTSPPYFGSGLDANPARYVRTLVEVFREVRLAGTLNLIVGDGDLPGMPWRVADALIADGWWLGQELIWPRPWCHDHIFVLSRDNNSPRRRSTVLDVPPEPHKGTRYQTLPESLLEPLILAGSAEGDLVVDPFAGSGTSGIVSTRFNRSFIGVEIEASSADWARYRISESQPSVATS